MRPIWVLVAFPDPGRNATIPDRADVMESNKERVEVGKTLIPGLPADEVIKTSIPFKKGVIAGLLIVLLVLCIGVLIGYGMGQYIATEHYARLLAECQAARAPWL